MWTNVTLASLCESDTASASQTNTFDYSLHNQTDHTHLLLENVLSTKYLGITSTDNMDWGQQISEISSKERVYD